MGDKSFVGMGVEVCPCCGNEHNESVLIHKQLRKVFEDRITNKNFMGWLICDACQTQFDDGRVGLVEADPLESTIEEDGSIKPEGAYRTGQILWIKREVFTEIFDVPLEDENFMFIDPQVVAHLKSLMSEEANDGN